MFDSIALSDPHDRFVILISLTHASDMRWWVQAKVFNSAKSWVKSLQDVWFIAVGAFMILSWVNWFLISSDSKIFGCYNHRLSKHTEDQGVRAASFVPMATYPTNINKQSPTWLRISHMTWIVWFLSWFPVGGRWVVAYDLRFLSRSAKISDLNVPLWNKAATSWCLPVVRVSDVVPIKDYNK